MFDRERHGNHPHDPVTRIRREIDELAEEDRAGWTAGALCDRVEELLQLQDELRTEVLRLIGAWDRSRAWEIDGALSPRAWLTHRTSTTTNEAGRLVKQARLLHDNPRLATALAERRTTTAHVEVIARSVSKNREPLLADHIEVLAEQAEQLPVSDFTTAMRHWASLADDELARDDYMNKWDRRHLHASVTLDGWVAGDFYLDPAAGQTFLAAIDQIAPPDPEDAPDGPRTLPQRRADGAVDLATWYLKGAKPHNTNANVGAIVDVASMLGIKPELASARCALEGVGPVARTVLDQMCCDARVTRFIMSGPSEVLDMGRSKRFPTTPQRRAVTVRDQHCKFPSCGRKPQWCDIHHVAGWVESLGETNVDNLILLCRRHHTLVHNSRWAIKVTADGEFEFIHPARGP